MDNNYLGEEFLCKVYPGLHTSKEVMARARKSDSPKEKVRRYLDKLDEITSKAMDIERATYENDSNLLKQMYYNKYLIKEENVPEAYFELQKRIALERGNGYLEYDEVTKEQEKMQIINEQRQSLDNWIDYLNGPDTKNYPSWFKYYAFQGMVKLGSFDKKTNK